MRHPENLHWGSTLDDFLTEKGIREDARAVAMIRAEAMTRQGLGKVGPATKKHTSRAQLDRRLRQ
jgi:antitoxin HicB